MHKTPPRMAALGIALTILAIGTGNVLSADQVAEAPDTIIESFDMEIQGFGVADILFEVPALPAMQKAC